MSLQKRDKSSQDDQSSIIVDGEYRQIRTSPIVLIALVVAACAIVVALVAIFFAFNASSKADNEVATALALAQPTPPSNSPQVVTVIVNAPTVSAPKIASPTQVANTPVPSATSVPTTSPTITPTSIPLPFSDNFDKGLNKLWIRENAGWRMANGQLVNTGDDGVIWLGRANWTDVVVEADIQSGCTHTTQILFRMQDPQNYMSVQLAHCGGGDDGIFLTKGGEAKRLVNGPGDNGHWKITAVGTIYTVYLNGNVVASVSDETFSAGSVGIQMGQAAEIDNFRVQQYSP